MRILGIDPGSRITGYGIIDIIDKKPIYIASGCIKTLPANSLAERISIIAHDIVELIETYRPNAAAIEQVFVNVNPTSTLILGQARGAAIAALTLKNVPVFEYSALQIKQTVVGQGKAAKRQVQHMIMNMLHLSSSPQADAADALATAITHFLRNRLVVANTQIVGRKIKGGRFI